MREMHCEPPRRGRRRPPASHELVGLRETASRQGARPRNPRRSRRGPPGAGGAESLAQGCAWVAGAGVPSRAALAPGNASAPGKRTGLWMEPPQRRSGDAVPEGSALPAPALQPPHRGRPAPVLSRGPKARLLPRNSLGSLTPPRTLRRTLRRVDPHSAPLPGPGTGKEARCVPQGPCCHPLCLGRSPGRGPRGRDPFCLSLPPPGSSLRRRALCLLRCRGCAATSAAATAAATQRKGLLASPWSPKPPSHSQNHPTGLLLGHVRDPSHEAPATLAETPAPDSAPPSPRSLGRLRLPSAAPASPAGSCGPLPAPCHPPAPSWLSHGRNRRCKA